MPSALLKFGGEVVADAQAACDVMADVAALVAAGWKIVLCHGGGPQLSRMQARLGIVPVMVGGRRVTDEATLQVTKCVLAGEVSVDVVASALAQGLRAVGISGVSDGLVTARKRPPRRVPGGPDEPVDFGWVGDVSVVRIELLETLLSAGYVPVVNSLGVDAQGDIRRPVYNINADTVASAIAVALKVDHLFLLTSVPGVLADREDPRTRWPALSATEARAAIADGRIAGGMIPKVEEALASVDAGVGAVHILGGGARTLWSAATEPGSVGTVLHA